MPDKKEFIIFVLLCIISLGLGYWYGMPDKPSEERAEAGAPPALTVKNVVTNILRGVVTNILAANPQQTPVKPRPTPTPAKPSPTSANIVPADLQNAIIEAAIRNAAGKPTGELTKSDLEKVTRLELHGNQLTEVTSLEKHTQLTFLNLEDNPSLTKAQIAELKKALPKCQIFSNAKKYNPPKAESNFHPAIKRDNIYSESRWGGTPWWSASEQI